MASSILDDLADDLADVLADVLANIHLSNPDPPATDATTGEVKSGLLRMPQEIYDIIFRDIFQDVVLVYLSDGDHASLKPVRGSPAQALGALRVCRELYHRAKPQLQAYATVVVAAGRCELGRDTALRGTAFWAHTRRFRRLHAAPGVISAEPVFCAAHLQSLVYWSEAYQLRDLLHLWPETAVLTLGAVSVTASAVITGGDVAPTALIRASCTSVVRQDLIFTELVSACHDFRFTPYGTICHALRSHSIGPGVTFLVRFRIQVPVWCERDEEVVQRDICVSATNKFPHAPPASSHAGTHPSA